MIDHVEKARRRACFRRWYFHQKSARDRSVSRGKVVRELGINHYRFYLMLEGRTYINDYRADGINKSINMGCIPGFEVDIFA